MFVALLLVVCTAVCSGNVMKVTIPDGDSISGSVGSIIPSVDQTVVMENMDRRALNELGSGRRLGEYETITSSFCYQGFYYDVGPHIIFSRNKEVLNFMLKVGDKDLLEHSRSNQIWYKGKFIQYPFENYLGLLDKKEKEMCLEDFLNNPYSDYEPQNMYQFFLKKFGYSITEKYLLPYNKKIWKFSPSSIDLNNSLPVCVSRNRRLPTIGGCAG